MFESTSIFAQKRLRNGEKHDRIEADVLRGGVFHETHPDGQQADDAEIAQDGRLRRVPGFLPVRMQDVLHGRQPGLREMMK